MDHAATQTTRHELQVLGDARRRDRIKKQRQRAKKDDQDEDGRAPSGESEGLSSGTVTPDSTGRTGEAGKAGQDRKKPEDERADETAQPGPPALVPASWSWETCPSRGFLPDPDALVHPLRGCGMTHTCILRCVVPDCRSRMRIDVRHLANLQAAGWTRQEVEQRVA